MNYRFTLIILIAFLFASQNSFGQKKFEVGLSLVNLGPSRTVIESKYIFDMNPAITAKIHFDGLAIRIYGKHLNWNYSIEGAEQAEYSVRKGFESGLGLDYRWNFDMFSVYSGIDVVYHRSNTEGMAFLSDQPEIERNLSYSNRSIGAGALIGLQKFFSQYLSVTFETSFLTVNDRLDLMVAGQADQMEDRLLTFVYPISKLSFNIHF